MQRRPPKSTRHFRQFLTSNKQYIKAKTIAENQPRYRYLKQKQAALQSSMPSTTTNLSAGNLPRLKAQELSSLLSTVDSAAKVTVVDVRDSDHVGGHIRNSIHVPTSALDYRIPELVRLLKDQDTVVFHCMLSQQRGPSAALKYARERVRMLGEEEGACRLDDADSLAAAAEEGTVKTTVQRVAVLEKGFEGWVQLYGRDEKLTDAFAADVWEMSFDPDEVTR